MVKKESNRNSGLKIPKEKTNVAPNAVNHGENSEAVPILGEDAAVFDSLRLGMVESFHPLGPFEEVLVGRLASLWWRLQRVGRAEQEGFKVAMEIMATGGEQVTRKFMCSLPVHVAFSSWGSSPGQGHVERLLRYEGQLERSFFSLLHELERMQARRQGHTVPLPGVADVNLHLTKTGD
jgi:hypothetical protein